MRASAEARAGGAIGGVDLDLFAGLGVFQRDDADVGQHLLPFVLNLDRDEIVTPARDRERAAKNRAPENRK